MLIGEASRQTGLSAKTIRFYSDEGLVHPRRDPFTGYRSFTETDLVRLRFLKKARRFNFSIKDCSELLSLYDREDRSSSDVKTIASKKVKESIQTRGTEFSLEINCYPLLNVVRAIICPIVQFWMHWLGNEINLGQTIYLPVTGIVSVHGS